MKVSKRKKNERVALMRQGRKCPNCGEDISPGGHYVPALDLWTCENQHGEPPSSNRLSNIVKTGVVFRGRTSVEKIWDECPERSES